MILSVKKSVVVTACVLAVVFSLLTILTVCTGASVVYFNGMTKKLPIYSVLREDNKISISFDCAYGAEYTDSILQTLDEYDVKCTFFAVKFWVEKFPDKAKKITEMGHEIGTHSSTHPHMPKLSKEKMRDELINSINAIEDITEQKVNLFRPPFGDYNNNLLTVAEDLGLYTIQWDVDSIDWKDLSAKDITQRVLKRVKSGSIILCHNNGLHTAEALPYILSNLKEKGYEFVKISDLIYKENYTIDPFGVQKQAV